MTEKELRANKIFTYNNDDYQVSNDKKDFKTAEVSFSDALNKFTIWFNDDLIFTNKSFEKLEKRVNKLLIDWDLKLIN